MLVSMKIHKNHNPMITDETDKIINKRTELRNETKLKEYKAYAKKIEQDKKNKIIEEVNADSTRDVCKL